MHGTCTTADLPEQQRAFLLIQRETYFQTAQQSTVQAVDGRFCRDKQLRASLFTVLTVTPSQSAASRYTLHNQTHNQAHTTPGYLPKAAGGAKA